MKRRRHLGSQWQQGLGNTLARCNQSIRQSASNAICLKILFTVGEEQKL